MELVTPEAAFGWEVLGGTLGALGGGVGGFFLGFFLCLSAAGQADPYGDLACIGAGALAYLIGTPLGATAGVSLAGNLHGVIGNPWPAFLGAAAGEGAGLLTLSLLSGGPFPPNDVAQPLIVLGGVPLLSGLGAALGYNVGARPPLATR